MRLPTYKELKRFVEVEGWEDKDKQSRKKKGDHHRYVFTTPTGDRLYTRVSHGSDQIYSHELFSAVLRDQLRIDEDQFWAAVDKGLKPRRPMPTPTPEHEGIDAKLARNLMTKVGMSPADLAGISQRDAVNIWNEWLARGGA